METLSDWKPNNSDSTSVCYKWFVTLAYFYKKLRELEGLDQMVSKVLFQFKPLWY